MPKIGNIKFRKRQVRKAAWIAIFAFVAIVTIVGTIAPYLNQ